MATAPPPVKAPPPPGKPAIPASPKPPNAPAAPARSPGNFSIIDWSGAGEGEKITIYAESGRGKTTLAALAPAPVFIGVDDGARKIRHPKTGAVLKAVQGIRDFADIRQVAQTPALFTGHKTVVFDTITKIEEMSDLYIFDHYKTDGGKVATSIEHYGFGKGYRHALEVMRMFLQDCEVLVRKGFNVILLAQESSATMPNSAGLDYLQAGPKLHHTKQYSSRLELQEWSDHVLRIGYTDTNVVGASNSTKGKIVSTNTDRVIYTQAQRHAFAKSRTLKEPIISFENPEDDSLWQFMFPS